MPLIHGHARSVTTERRACSAGPSATPSAKMVPSRKCRVLKSRSVVPVGGELGPSLDDPTVVRVALIVKPPRLGCIQPRMSSWLSRRDTRSPSGHTAPQTGRQCHSSCMPQLGEGAALGERRHGAAGGAGRVEEGEGAVCKRDLLRSTSPRTPSRPAMRSSSAESNPPPNKALPRTAATGGRR